MSRALSRRSALCGGVAASLGAVAGIAPALAVPAVTCPDAALIEFAGRVARLARREDEVRGRMIDAQAPLDRWNFANRPREPKLPKVPDSMVVMDVSTPTHRITQISESREPDPVRVAIDAANNEYRTACEAHRLTVEARVAESSVPRLERLTDRMRRRLVRDVDRLTDMEPSALVGLAAKAAVLVALGKSVHGELDGQESLLAISLAQDAMRLQAWASDPSTRAAVILSAAGVPIGGER